MSEMFVSVTLFERPSVSVWSKYFLSQKKKSIDKEQKVDSVN
jgi:hypothetical protein